MLWSLDQIHNTDSVNPVEMGTNQCDEPHARIEKNAPSADCDGLVKWALIPSGKSSFLNGDKAKARSKQDKNYSKRK